MSNARKLQGEIDRTFKKVAEGIAEYEAIMEKINTAATPAQKEKYEGDLKSQIKKLQRLREQIKTWIASNELKNKAPLIEQRKKIETQMERYKVYEREAKTKAYSKEGLQSQREKAKREDARSEITRWLQRSIDELKVQIDTLEASINDAKKKKGGSGDSGVAKLERHHFHLNALEKILRMWENESLTKEEIDEIRDGVDYYIQNNQDPDFVEDESLYEPLGIDASNVNVPSASSATEDEEDGDEEKDEESDTTERNGTSEESSRASAPASAPAKAASAPPKTAANGPAPKAASAKTTAAPPKTPTKAAPAKTPAAAAAPSKQTEPPPAEKDASIIKPTARTNTGRNTPSPAPTPANPSAASSTNPATSGSQSSSSANAPSTSSGAAPQSANAAPNPSSGTTQAQAQTEQSAPTPTVPLQHSPVALMLASLTNSYNNLPDPDYSRPQQYKPRNPYATPPYYPQVQLPIFENPALFEKFDVDTLFFIFYYQQGTYQQYLAAKELKRQSWRYHKKYLTWFQRHEEPKEITPEYEQGTYIYFDYETGWCQRKKTEFTFQYRYLEDKDLV